MQKTNKTYIESQTVRPDIPFDDRWMSAAQPSRFQPSQKRSMSNFISPSTGRHYSQNDSILFIREQVLPLVQAGDIQNAFEKYKLVRPNVKIENMKQDVYHLTRNVIMNADRMIKTAKIVDVEYSVGIGGQPKSESVQVRLDEIPEGKTARDIVEKKLEKKEKKPIIITKYVPRAAVRKKTGPSQRDESKLRRIKKEKERAKKTRKEYDEQQRQKRIDSLLEQMETSDPDDFNLALQGLITDNTDISGLEEKYQFDKLFASAMPSLHLIRRADIVTDNINEQIDQIMPTEQISSQSTQSIFEFVADWEPEGYGLALIDTDDNVVTAYIDPSDYPEMIVEKGSKIIYPTEYNGYFIMKHSGQLEENIGKKWYDGLPFSK
jgi:hypothetical protein